MELTGNVSPIAGKVAWAKSPADGIFGKDKSAMINGDGARGVHDGAVVSMMVV